MTWCRRTSSTRVFDDAAAHAARALEARDVARRSRTGRCAERWTTRSTSRVGSSIAVLALRHGDRVRAAVRVVDHADGQRRALGLEALDVILSREEAAIALPLVRRDLTPDEQAAALSEASRRAVRRSGSRT